MTRGSHYLFRRLLLLLFLSLVLVALASGQEGQRQLTGQFITGYSSFDVSGEHVQGGYAGVNANLAGYWNDPRIFTYNVNPTMVKGFQWAGPMAGPESNGVSADSTFLGGSHIPFHFFFSRQQIPTPNLPLEGVNFQGLSRDQQDVGFDWRMNFEHLPLLNVHYSRDDYTAQFPQSVGGNLDSKARTFRLDGVYNIAKWQLNGDFINQDNKAETLGLLSSTGIPLAESIHDRGLDFSASRPLFWNSQLLLAVTSHDLNLDTGTGPIGNSYTSGNAGFSSRPTDRLATNVHIGYVTNYADYARQQIFSGAQNPTPGVLSGLDLGYLSAGAAATYRLAKGLFASAGYNTLHSLTNSDIVGSAGDTDTVVGGLNYSRGLFGGQLSSGYSISDSRFRFSAGHIESLQHAISGAYARRLPAEIQFNAMGNFTNSTISNSQTDTVRGYGGAFDLSRRVGAGWQLRGRVALRQQTYEFPQRNEYDFQQFSLSAISKKIQVTASKMFDSGLAYRYGNGVVVVPGAEPGIPGLPAFINTHGNSMSLSVMYMLKRNLTLRGSMSRGFRSVDGDNEIYDRVADIRADYQFRKTHFAAGYDKRWQNFTRRQDFSYFGEYFYFELRRDFRLF